MSRKTKLLTDSPLFSNDDNNNKIQSPNGRYSMVIQNDCNLVVYEDSKGPIFASNSYKNTNQNYKLVLQTDGNLVIYDPYSSAKWSTNTYNKGVGPYTLTLENTGILIIKDSKETVLWTSNNNTLVTDDQISSAPDQKVIFKDEITSPNNKYQLKLNDRGNLFICENNRIVIWESNSNSNDLKSPFRCIVQDDGNIVVYDFRNRCAWASNTEVQGNNPFTLYLEDSGTLILRESNGNITWSSNPSAQNPENFSYEDQILLKFKNNFLDIQNPMESQSLQLLNLIKSFEEKLNQKDVDQLKSISKEMIDIIQLLSQGVLNQIIILKNYQDHLGELKGILLVQEVEENAETERVQKELQVLTFQSSLQGSIFNIIDVINKAQPVKNEALTEQVEIFGGVYRDLTNRISCKANVIKSNKNQVDKIRSCLESTNNNISQSNQIISNLHNINVSVSSIIDEKNMIEILKSQGDQFKDYVTNSMNSINDNGNSISKTTQINRDQFLSNIRDIKLLKL